MKINKLNENSKIKKTSNQERYQKGTYVLERVARVMGGEETTR